MSARSRSLPSQLAADSFGSSETPSSEGASLTAEEVADSYINWPVDTPMGDGTVNPRDLLLPSAPPVGMPSASNPPGHSRLNPFGAPPAAQSSSVDAQGSQEPPGNVSGRPQRRSATDRSSREITHARPSNHRENARGSRAMSPVPSRRSRRSEDLPEPFTKAEISDLRILLQTFDRHTKRENYHRQSIENLNDWCSMLQEELREAEDTIRSIELANCSFTRNTRRNSPSRESNRHHPYPGRERPASRAIRAPRHEEPSHAATAHTPSHETARNSTIAGAPGVTEDVFMEPVGIATQSTQSIAPTTFAASATAPLPRTPAGPIRARAVRPEKRGPTPMADYRYMDRATGIRHALAISPAGLPMFPGSICIAFQRLQGASQSPAELTRRVWLLYRGRSHLETWKDAVTAAREVRRKVILPQPLLLLLELADLPRNEWEKITELWATSSDPLSSISPGIRLNPNGFAGLDNHDIDTADFVRMWTSGSLKRISTACGQEKDRSDVKSAFHIALTSPNIWGTKPGVLQTWVPTPNLKRLRYDGILEPNPIALWLRKEVGLTSFDVQTRFAPFARRAFDTNASTNPRAYFTTFVSPEAYPSLADDSLLDFGDDLKWTPACRPRGSPLKPKASMSMGKSSSSKGVADTNDMRMEG